MVQCLAGLQSCLRGRRGLHAEREEAVLELLLAVVRGTFLWIGPRGQWCRSALEAAGTVSLRARHRPEGFAAMLSRSASTAVLYTSGLRRNLIRCRTR